LTAGCGGNGVEVGRNSQLYVTRANGDGTTQLTRDGISNAFPSWSPDGRRLAYAALSPNGSRVVVIRPDGSGRRVLVRRPRRSVLGLSWSPAGPVLAFVGLGESRASARLETVAVQIGRSRELLRYGMTRVLDVGPSWSPDGKRLAIVRPSGRLQVEVTGADGASRRRVTSAPRGAWAPQWSPDGRSLLVTEQVTRSFSVLFSVPAGGGSARRIAGRFVDVRASWSPDGRRIAVIGVTEKGDRRYHLYLAPAQGGELDDIGVGVVQATCPAWSPDGRLIAFADYDGRVRVVDVDGNDERTLTTLRAAHIHELTWSPDGSRIAFTAAEPPED
jgi:TolB protein